MCPRTLSDRHDQTETDRALWFFSTGPQRTNWSLQTGLGSDGCSLQRNRDSTMEEVDFRRKKRF